MQGSRGRRRTGSRIIGWGLTAVAYATVLAFASGISADPAAAQPAAAQPAGAETPTNVAGVLAAAPAEASVGEVAVATARAGVAEEPAVTLALAGGTVVVGGLAYLLHTIYGRLTRRAARRRESVAQLVARQITTLM